jgi:hypothetical protein
MEALRGIIDGEEGPTMDLNPYAVERMVATKLDEAREATRRRALVRGLREPRPLRVRLGALLIHLGTALASSEPVTSEESHSHAR